MGFFRRFKGATKQKTGEHDAIKRPEAEVAAPGTPVEIEPPQPVVQVPKGIKSDAPPLPPEGYGATRQLPPIESLIGKPGKHLIAGLSSDVGLVRNNNQDSLFVMFSSHISADGLPDFGLFVVADGMGGHLNGERASALATREVARYITNEFLLKVLDMKDEERPIIAEVLSDALQRANEVVAAEIPEGGTTVTAAAVVGDLAYIAHVGDSRAYLLTMDGIEQITRDHTLVQRLIELDQLTPDEAAAHPQRHVLYRALGQNEQIEIDTITRRLPAGSRLLLCSDGLWTQVPEDKLLQTVTASRTPQDACDKLVNMANERGGSDNITIVLVQVPG